MSVGGGEWRCYSRLADLCLLSLLSRSLGLDNTGAALPSALRRSRSPSAADDVAAGASPPKRQKKKKKVSFSLEDPRIELTDGDVQAQVDDYTRSMAEQYAEKEEREAARRADGWVRDMLHNAPADREHAARRGKDGVALG